MTKEKLVDDLKCLCLDLFRLTEGLAENWTEHEYQAMLNIAENANEFLGGDPIYYKDELADELKEFNGEDDDDIATIETYECEHCGYEYDRMIGDYCPSCGHEQEDMDD